VLSIITLSHPADINQSSNSSSARVVVPNDRVSFTTVSSALTLSRQTHTTALCTSIPAQTLNIRCMTSSFWANPAGSAGGASV
jgi:hypothetical protein